MPYGRFDAVALSLGPINIPWYAIACVAAFLIVWQQMQRLAAMPNGEGTTVTLSRGHVVRLVTCCIFALIVGARLGDALLYEPELLTRPADLIAIWRGGLSFHGALVGVVAGCYVFCWFYRVPISIATDLICATIPLAIGMVRIGSFLNNELVGKASTLPWAMAVPGHGPILRHPSPLYEAILEGLVLYLLLHRLVVRGVLSRRPGLVSGLFLIAYAALRAVAELFREQDPHVLDVVAQIPMSWWLAGPMVTVGLFWVRAAHAPGLIDPRPLKYSRQEVVALLTTGSAATLILGGCSSGKPPNFPSIPTGSIRLGNVNGEPKCGCASAQGVYISHSSSKTASVSWVGRVTDLNSGLKTTVYDVARLIAPKTEQFIGCTRYEPATSCRSAAIYDAGQVSTLAARAASAAWADSRAPLAIAKVAGASCRALCTGTTTAECLALGVRYYRAVGPIVSMLAQFPRNPDGTLKDGTVTKDQILARYNANPSADQCRRGNVVVRDNLIANEGAVQECRVKSEDLPLTTVRQMLHATRTKTTAGVVEMWSSIPQRLEAMPLDSTGGAGTALIGFSRAAYGPAVSFGGGNGAVFTRTYGGAVLSATRKLGVRNMTILSTSNGCVSVNEP